MSSRNATVCNTVCCRFAVAAAAGSRSTITSAGLGPTSQADYTQYAKAGMEFAAGSEASGDKPHMTPDLASAACSACCPLTAQVCFLHSQPVSQMQTIKLDCSGKHNQCQTLIVQPFCKADLAGMHGSWAHNACCCCCKLCNSWPLTLCVQAPYVQYKLTTRYKTCS